MADEPPNAVVAWLNLAGAAAKLVFLALVIWLAVSMCSSSKNTTEATRATTTRVETTAPLPKPDIRPAPTNAEVVEAFETWINERASSGVMLAQSVTSVTMADGVLTVTVDPGPVVLELSPFDNHAELFGTPAAFDDEQGVWLRRSVQRVDVVDASGRSLGSMTATELNRRATVG